jgi:hypothetical protein
MSTPALSLRAICSEDEPFLQRVYAITTGPWIGFRARRQATTLFPPMAKQESSLQLT